jgi:alpha-tubulin suppressor-like RCC1 family protein
VDQIGVTGREEGFSMMGIRKVALVLACVLGWAALAAPGPAAAATPPHPRSHVWAWGAGELGIANGIRVAPVPIHLGFPLQIVAGGDAGLGGVVLGLHDGSVWAWGNGPPGNGSTGSTTPVQITTLPPIQQLAGNGAASYALADNGTVLAWGNGTNGELGDGSFTSSLTPVQVKGLTGISAIYADGDTAYALRSSDHRLFAWGAGTSGQLGNGQLANSDRPVPVHVPDGVQQVVAHCGAAYALSSKRPGRVFAWGFNGSGQLGNGTLTNEDTPVLVHQVTTADSVAAGCGFAYAIVGTAHKVMAWGSGGFGQLGDRHKASQLTPVPVINVSGVASLATSTNTAYAVLSDGSVWAWGYGATGEIGRGHQANTSVPAKLTSITSPIKTVLSGDSGQPGSIAIVALGTDGSLWSWGEIGQPWNGATGLGTNGHANATATATRIPRLPAICGLGTLGGVAYFASTCS